jgi:hypothetical protein
MYKNLYKLALLNKYFNSHDSFILKKFKNVLYNLINKLNLKKIK